MVWTTNRLKLKGSFLLCSEPSRRYVNACVHVCLCVCRSSSFWGNHYFQWQQPFSIILTRADKPGWLVQEKSKERRKEANTSALKHRLRCLWYTDATENLFCTQIKTEFVFQRAGRRIVYKRLCSLTEKETKSWIDLSRGDKNGNPKQRKYGMENQ